MRTTVPLDPDPALLLERRMSERNVSFKRGINDVIRESAAGSGSEAATPFETQTASMGASRINLKRALQVASELDDDEFVRAMQAGSCSRLCASRRSRRSFRRRCRPMQRSTVSMPGWRNRRPWSSSPRHATARSCVTYRPEPPSGCLVIRTRRRDVKAADRDVTRPARTDTSDQR